ncbi:hypothetical protein D3879_16120 [Pseudomonas cavernicola]|uniref:DUF6160 domain-containing protein n=1 Tax=Pseudomonas cavernicola TaxID=2320866 RepID=A0A418XAS9_9PSED|nr:DUF6160 family protein [Pseudomonas cavernicola]RJG09596.1 hypothetical protein D3879_16070 [Pseudomonas cavernicola]RJG09602.1 hypothetical protein D3879_16120 [Pseudomonas cavernicola]
MKSLKQLALVAAVLAVPFMAQADLKAMDDSALSTVTGQDGISISGNFGGAIGNVAYTDSGNSLHLNNIAFSGFTILDTAPVTVDVIDNGAGLKQLAIGLPGMTGTVSVGGIYVGGTYAAGAVTGAASIGALAISDMNMAGTTVKVWGH